MLCFGVVGDFTNSTLKNGFKMNDLKCIFCDLPIQLIMIDAGDGWVQKFAHHDCYWKDQAQIFEQKFKGSEEINKILFEAKNHWADRARALEELCYNFATGKDDGQPIIDYVKEKLEHI